jgi:hypothetical protein
MLFNEVEERKVLDAGREGRGSRQGSFSRSHEAAVKGARQSLSMPRWLDRSRAHGSTLQTHDAVMDAARRALHMPQIVSACLVTVALMPSQFLLEQPSVAAADVALPPAYVELSVMEYSRAIGELSIGAEQPRLAFVSLADLYLALRRAWHAQSRVQPAAIITVYVLGA